MDYLQREGRPTDQERTAPCWATCGGCAWIRDLWDWTLDKEEEAKFGLCVEEEPYARVRKDASAFDSPCGGEQWVMR